MLSMFRAFLNTWIARVFFVVLVASFGLWGIGDVVRNMGHDSSLATVGDRHIEGPEFQDAYRRNLAQVTRMMGGTEPTPDVRKAVANEALERLIVQAAIANEVQRLGIAVPDAALRQAVFAIPAFRGPAGTFDRGVFETVMRNNNMTEGSFLELMRSDLAQRQLMETVQAGVTPPETLLKQVYAFQRETRAGQVVELPFTAAPAPSAPTQDDLQREYENNSAAYSAPAYRRIKLVVLSPQTLAHGIEVSPEDIQAYYDAHKADYVTEEKRSAEIVVVPDADAAKKLAATWTAGADWSAMQKAAQAAGGSAVAVDDSVKQQFPSTELADAVFADAPNTVSAPIKSALGGWQIVQVTKVIAGQSRTLDQVKDEIQQKVAQERAVDQVYTRANKLDDALSSGTSLDDLPGDLGAAGLAGTLDAQGNTPEGQPAPIPGSPDLRKAIIAAAFKAAKGDPPRMVEGPDQSYYALQVEDVIEPKLKPLTDVEAQVREDWEQAQRRHEQDAVAARLMTAAQAGGSLDDAATIAGLRVEKTPPITRDGTNEHVPPPIQQALFRLKQNETTMVETPDAFWVVRLTDISDPDLAQDPVGSAQFREALTRALDQDVEIVFATTLRNRAQPRVNRVMVDSLSE